MNRNELYIAVRRIVLRLWLCIFLAFLLLRLALCEYVTVENRFYLQWQRGDILGVFVAVLLLGFALTLIHEMGGRMGKVARFVRDVGFAMAIMFYLKVAFVEIVFANNAAPHWLEVVLKIFLLVPVLSLFFYRSLVVQMLDRLCLILSPIVILYFVGLLLAKPYDAGFMVEVPTGSRLHDMVVQANQNKIKKIVILIFDEMTYKYIFDKNEVHAGLPNISSFACNSFVFHKAYSTADATYAAMPGMLCGVVGFFDAGTQPPSLKSDKGSVNINNLPNLMRDMQDAGYGVHFATEGFDYGKLLGFPSTALLGASQKEHGLSRVTSIALRIWRYIASVRIGWIHPVINNFLYKAAHAQYIKAIAALHETVLRELSNKDRSFVLAHYDLPHFPYLFDRSGPLPLSESSFGAEWDVDGYMRNLYYADTLLGELLQAIRSSPAFEKTLVIVAADHCVRSDPGFLPAKGVAVSEYYEYCHVPFMVHLPGQKERIDIDDPFSMVRFQEVISLLVEKDLDVGDFKVLVSGGYMEDIRCAIDLFVPRMLKMADERPPSFLGTRDGRHRSGD